MAEPKARSKNKIYVSREIKPTWLKNWPLVFGGISVCFVAARLLGISAGDPETAYAILQSQGTTSVIVGSLISAIGLLAPAAAFLAIRVVMGPTNDGISKGIMFALAVGAALLTLLDGPAVLIAGSLLLSFPISIIARTYSYTYKSAPDGKGPYSGKDVILAAYVASALVLTTLTTTPWIPAEDFSVKGHPVVTGYMLSQDNGIDTILTYKPTGVMLTLSGDISRQVTCRAPNYWKEQETINQYLGGFMNRANGSITTKYPPCEQ
jgi:hypothetical protein